MPLVVIRDRQQPERFFNNLTPFGATVVLRPSLAVLAGTAPPIGAESSHGPLEFYDPLRVSSVAVGQQQIAMATNTSAALEYMLKDTSGSMWEGLMQPGSAEAWSREAVPAGTASAGQVPAGVCARVLLVASHLGRHFQRDPGSTGPPQLLSIDPVQISNRAAICGVRSGPAS